MTFMMHWKSESACRSPVRVLFVVSSLVVLLLSWFNTSFCVRCSSRGHILGVQYLDSRTLTHMQLHQLTQSYLPKVHEAIYILTSRNESMPRSIFSPYVIWPDFFAKLEGIKGCFFVCLFWTFLLCLTIFSFILSLVVWVYSFVKNLFKVWDDFVVCHMITEYDNSLYVLCTNLLSI